MIFHYCLNNCLNNRYNQFNLNRIKFHNSKEVYTKELNDKKFRLKNKKKNESQSIFNRQLKLFLRFCREIMSSEDTGSGEETRREPVCGDNSRNLRNDRSSGNIFTTDLWSSNITLYSRVTIEIFPFQCFISSFYFFSYFIFSSLTKVEFVLLNILCRI